MSPYRSTPYRVAYTPGFVLFLVWCPSSSEEDEHIPGIVRRDKDGFYIIDIVSDRRGGLSMDKVYYDHPDNAESIALRILNDYVKPKKAILPRSIC